MSGPKKDCFAWNEKRHQCDVLDEVVCKHRRCTFYMNNDEHELKQREAELDRLEKEKDKAMQKKNEIAKIYAYKDRVWRFTKL